MRVLNVDIDLKPALKAITSIFTSRFSSKTKGLALHAMSIDKFFEVRSHIWPKTCDSDGPESPTAPPVKKV